MFAVMITVYIFNFSFSLELLLYHIPENIEGLQLCSSIYSTISPISFPLFYFIFYIVLNIIYYNILTLYYSKYNFVFEVKWISFQFIFLYFIIYFFILQLSQVFHLYLL